MNSIDLVPSETALVLIDLQNGIVGRPAEPYSSADVMARSRDLADVCRKNSAMVIYVRVDVANMVNIPVDKPSRDPRAPPPPASFSEISPDAGKQVGDELVTKHHWDAFHGTNLAQLLGKHSIRNIILGGIATNIGVESTARSAASLGFAVILAEDAMASMSAEAHKYAVENIFPRLGRVRSTAEIKAALLPK